MMTIPSIDMMTASDMAVVESVPQQAAALSPYERLTPQQPLSQQMPAFGGLGELIADNAALGEALQALVDGMDKPSAAMQSADAMPLTRQVVEPSVLVRSEGNFVSADEVAPVSAQSRDVAGQVEKTLGLVRSDGSSASEAVLKSAAGTTDDAERELSEGVVLQAASVAVMSAVDGAVSTSETTVEAVTAVSRVEAADLSTLFLAAADAVAAAVTVSPELMRGEAGEIRVQLRPDVLEGSEVVVAVDGRKMDVTFVPTVTHVADTLASNQSLMQNQLAARIAGFEISVGVAQAVATNVAVNVGSERAAQMAVNRARKTNGRA